MIYPHPSERQLKWHALEVYVFLHFTVNTFTDKEWGYGDESPEVFHPTDFDADSIVSVAKEGGLKGLILTCKHHDGFCLWPSAYTEHSVKNSSWRGGTGDVVREISEACQRHGLRFGVYLSPWDRNRHDYGLPSYIDYYRNQLTELLTHYGPIFEVWFDGANGGDGYYGGARETRLIDKNSYYDWQNTWDIVRRLQPDACIFSDAGPDVRWVGNEHGIAGDPCWATLNTEGMAPGLADPDELNRGHREGSRWLPAECDVSIRPGWFYHSSEDDQVKNPRQLLDLYYQSVGRGASLLINLPPDRRGRIHEKDAQSLLGFRRLFETTFQANLARGANGPAQLVDGNPESFWSAETNAADIILDFSNPVHFNVISLREYLPQGQRVEEFAVDVWGNDGWNEIARAASIGSRRLLRLPENQATRLRLRILSANQPPVLNELGLYREP